MGVQIHVLGVGANLGDDVLKQIAAGGLYYRIQDFRDFVHKIDRLTTEEAAKVNLLIPRFFLYNPSIEKAPTKFYKIDDDLELWINLFNPTADRTVPKFTKFHLEQSEFYFAAEVAIPLAIVPLGNCLVKRAATLEKFPGKLEFSFSIGNFQQKGMVQLSTGFLRGDFISPHPVNVLLFGSKGSGKSALANGFVTCLGTCKEVSRSVTTLKSDYHITKNYQKIWLGQEIKDAEDDDEGFIGPIHDEIKLHVFDPWGIADKEYKTINLSHLLKGQLPPGTHMAKASDKWVPTDLANQIHVVVFVVKVGAIHNTNEMKTIKDSISIASGEGYNPIVVITRMDEVKDDPLEFEEAKKAARRELSVEGDSIFFHTNYNDSTFRVPETDLSVFFILRVVYERARMFMQTNLRNLIKTIPWKNETILKDDSILIQPTIVCPTPPTPRSGSEIWKCDDGHIRAVGDSTKFCGTCGKEFKIAVSEVWKCGAGVSCPNGKFILQDFDLLK